MESPPDFFTVEPVPGEPGWFTWDLKDPTRFNGQVMGPLRIRKDDGKSRLRMFPEVRHTNLQNAIHGATTLGLIDIALFTAMHMFGTGDPGMAVTLELNTQFIGAGKPDEPLDAVTELVRETRRLAFMRGEVVQGDHIVAAYSGLIRRPSVK